MEYPIDPSFLNRPMSELALPDDQRSEGIQVRSAEAPTQEATGEDTDSSQNSEEDSKVPYRRFKKFHDRALEAEQEAAYWREQAMSGKPQDQSQSQGYYVPNDAPNVEPTFSGSDWERFKNLFGGADESLVKDAYRQEVQRLAAIEDRAMRRAVETFEQRGQQEEQQIRQNMELLDQNLEEAADILGRDLTPNEQVAILDIQDDYSPKDRNGNIVALLPIEKAVELYEMQQSRSQAPKRNARNAIAAASGSSSGGDTSVAASSQEKNANFQPGLGWRANFKRITGKDPSGV